MALFAIGWVLVLVSTFLINHFELFGLQQAWLHVTGAKRPRRNSASPYFTRSSAIRSISFFSPFGRRLAISLRPSAAGSWHVGLYADRNSLRGARPRSTVWKRWRRLSLTG